MLINSNEALNIVIKRFVEESYDTKNSFLAFRQYIAKYLLIDIILKK